MKLTALYHALVPIVIALTISSFLACSHKGTEPADPAPYRDVVFQPGEKPRVVINTDLGTFSVELWPTVAPKHCQSFVYLVNKGFYNGLTFHRVIPGFVIQGGDPLGNGTGGPGYRVPAEFSDNAITFGSLCMARLVSDSNSAGSRFFIALGRLSSLDRKYTVFGRVDFGIAVLDSIEHVHVVNDTPVPPIHMNDVHVALWD